MKYGEGRARSHEHVLMQRTLGVARSWPEYRALLEQATDRDCVLGLLHSAFTLPLRFGTPDSLERIRCLLRFADGYASPDNFVADNEKKVDYERLVSAGNRFEIDHWERTPPIVRWRCSQKAMSVLVNSFFSKGSENDFEDGGAEGSETSWISLLAPLIKDLLWFFLDGRSSSNLPHPRRINSGRKPTRTEEVVRTFIQDFFTEAWQRSYSPTRESDPVSSVYRSHRGDLLELAARTQILGTLVGRCWELDEASRAKLTQLALCDSSSFDQPFKNLEEALVANSCHPRPEILILLLDPAAESGRKRLAEAKKIQELEREAANRRRALLACTPKQ